MMSANNNDAAMGQSWAVSAEQDLTDEVAESFIYIKQEFEEEDWEDEAREPLARNNEAADEPPVWSQYPNEPTLPPPPPTRRHPSDPEAEAAKVYTMFKCGKSEDGPEYAVRPWSTTIKRHRGAEWQPYCAQDDGPLPEPHTAGRLIEPFNKTLPDLYQKGFNMLFNKRDGGETSLDLLDCSPGASQAFYGWIPKRFMPRRGTIGYWGFDG
ncbi:hypothetical protein D7B24_006265 [Verticillium nonalfalfae]|uniref:Uncharacterized protein n=1 Tax=Verticillium nonalfalfae TaxID=1051616 RepID=A0A3M9YAB8_9PEZI|nr:uncharacterized protein D7B24_006265 [Verticillium nonalfalfae]RNJ57231.1 hypothetical protein D7B24_006265 [Verticillium nonalfalfae]